MISRNHKQKSGFKNAPRPRRGTSVVEMIATTVVLGTIVGISLPMLKLVTSERQAAVAHEQALAAASNIMENVSALPFEKIKADATAAQLPDWAKEQLIEPSLQVEVERVPDASAKKIHLRLEWKSSRGYAVAPIQLTSWVYQRGDQSVDESVNQTQGDSQ